MKIANIIGSLLITVITVTGIATLTGCGEDKVSFETLETQRSVANENSRYNAQKWRADNGFETLNILSRGDSTQQTNCPQGDGWASVDLIDTTTKQKMLGLKCSTVSAAVGCIPEADFKGRAVLASQENKCNADIPTNLKKIEN